MGRSFHWMDRVDTLKRLERLIEPAGAVALFNDSAPAIPANAWRKVWNDIRAIWSAKAGSARPTIVGVVSVRKLEAIPFQLLWRYRYVSGYYLH